MIIHGIGGPADGNSDRQPTGDSLPSDNKEDDSLLELNDKDKHLEKVKIAYYFYNKFKGLLVDAILGLKDKKQSREYFKKRKPIEFIKIVTTELHLMYDIFYTKVFLINKKLQYARLFCFLSVIASLVLFSLEDKRNYYEVDVTITFTLLGGAIVLDICAMAMFIMSDWWVIITFINDRSRFIKPPMKMLYEWTKWARTPKCCRSDRSISSYNLLERCFKVPPLILDYIRIKRVRDIFVGWMYVRTKPLDDTLIEFIIKELQIKAEMAEDNNTTHQVCSARGNLVLQEDYYLISECLSPWTIDIDYDESLLIWHLATDICYRTSGQDATPDQTIGKNATPNQTDGQNVTPDQTDGQNATSGQTIGQNAIPAQTGGQNATHNQTDGQNATPGQTIGQNAKPDQADGQNATPGQTNGQNTTPVGQSNGQNATPDQTIGQNVTPDQTIGQNATPDQTIGQNATLDHRDFSKKLSDYMLYLLLKREELMSPVVGISDIRFEDTCAEAKKFYKKSYSWSKEILAKIAEKVNCKCRPSTEIHQRDTTEEVLLKEFCEEVLKVKSILKPIVAKGDKSKSVLFDACRLAKQLKMFKEKQWEITSKVWVELLGYAAIRCNPRSHLARLNQGGELITLVWLCMAQLGLGERFGQNQGFGWTKLIMEHD
ncbi:uncharacterized protein LOC141600549 [Silene latifolia]|uniref:uncharacterized protein LOC141600549 n=1 Tax=Silene latifolia TaxID=37657 RepID=UPI003D78238B